MGFPFPGSRQRYYPWYRCLFSKYSYILLGEAGSDPALPSPIPLQEGSDVTIHVVSVPAYNGWRDVRHAVGAIVKGGIFFKGRIGSAVAARDPTIKLFFAWRHGRGSIPIQESADKIMRTQGQPKGSTVASLQVSYTTRKRKLEKETEAT